MSAPSDWPRARAAYERVLAPALEYHAAEPANDGIARMLARTHSALAEVLHALNDVPGALKHHREALRINLERLARAPGATQAKLDVSWNYSETGWLEHERHQEVAAVADFDRALALLRSIAATAPLKSDYPAGTMFDMGTLRTRVAAQLDNCTGDPGNRPRPRIRSSASR